MQDMILQLCTQLAEIKTINNYPLQLATKLRLEEAMATPTVPAAAARLTLKKINTWLQTLHRLEKELADLQELMTLLAPEALEFQLQPELAGLVKQGQALYLATLFSDEEDQHTAFMEIQAGNGGIDAQDCAEIIMRMYCKFVIRHGLTSTFQDITYGEVKGIRSCTMEIQGPYAFGWLKTESGIHRLVRHSPFDAQHKRHTSFVSVYVYPKVSAPADIIINPADIRVDTFKASGAGGQHVNKTDSAVRIHHLPTKIIVQCQSDRSQHRNRSLALAQLTSKLHQLALKTLRQQHEAQRQARGEITWGGQIRSYVFDQGRIKDLRINTETHQFQKVLDGELELFIKNNLIAEKKKLWTKPD